MYTNSAEGEKQVCDNMNKICELLLISILMTNHHANQARFVASNCRLVSRNVSRWKCALKAEECSENGTGNTSELKTITSRYGCGSIWTSGEGENGGRLYRVACSALSTRRSHTQSRFLSIFSLNCTWILLKFINLNSKTWNILYHISHFIGITYLLPNWTPELC